MPPSHAKMRLEGAPQKVNFLMKKSIQKSYTLNCSHKCPCTFSHSYALLRRFVFEKKNILCETKNIFYSLGNQKLDKANDPKSTLKINMKSHRTVFQILLMTAVFWI